MALAFPITDIRNKKFTVVEVATGNIIARGRTWPHIEIDDNTLEEVGLPIVGDTGAFKYFLEVASTKPDSDTRLYQMVGTETYDEQAQTVTDVWEAVRRDVEDRKAAVVNEEGRRFANLTNIPECQLNSKLAITALLDKVFNNQDPGPQAQAVIDQYLSEGISLWANRGRRIALEADMTNNVDANLDLWPYGNEPTNPV